MILNDKLLPIFYEYLVYEKSDKPFPPIVGIRKDAPKEAKKAYKKWAKKRREIEEIERDTHAFII